MLCSSKYFIGPLQELYEYCNSLLIGVNKTLKEKLEDANHCGFRTIMNMGKNSDYEPLLKMANICILLNIDASNNL